MLVVYTFVFSIVFRARWGQDIEVSFALIIFVGLIIHYMFAEVLARSPGQILSNANYVHKVIFPLEILTVVNVLSAIFHLLISLFVFIIASAYLSELNWDSLFLLPITLMPIIPLTMGFLGFCLRWVFIYEICPKQ